MRKWVCLKIGYIPIVNSHLIGIMISKTIGFRGFPYFQTHPNHEKNGGTMILLRSLHTSSWALMALRAASVAPCWAMEIQGHGRHGIHQLSGRNPKKLWMGILFLHIFTYFYIFLHMFIPSSGKSWTDHNRSSSSTSYIVWFFLDPKSQWLEFKVWWMIPTKDANSLCQEHTFNVNHYLALQCIVELQSLWWFLQSGV